MEKEKLYLIGMTDFVLELNIEASEKDDWDFCAESFNKISNYAKFLKQPLSIEMFVTCKLVDGVWVVLEEPKMDMSFASTTELKVMYKKALKEYQKAQEKVLFEGLSICDRKGNINCVVFNNEHIFWEGKTIETLTKYNLELTPNAVKKLNL